MAPCAIGKDADSLADGGAALGRSTRTARCFLSGYRVHLQRAEGAISKCRLAVPGASREEWAANLRLHLEGRGPALHGIAQKRRPRLAMVFSGQGTQWQSMERALLEKEPVFRETIPALCRSHRCSCAVALARRAAGSRWYLPPHGYGKSLSPQSLLCSSAYMSCGAHGALSPLQSWDTASGRLQLQRSRARLRSRTPSRSSVSEGRFSRKLKGPGQ